MATSLQEILNRIKKEYKDGIIDDTNTNLSKALNDYYKKTDTYTRTEIKALIASGGEITIDSEMSDTSENPVQNKVVKAYVDNNQGTIKSISSGSANGTIAVETADGTSDVAVKGLHSAAYSSSSSFATSTHTHDNYALTGHTHSDYALTTHTHSDYAAKSHTHTSYAAKDHNHQRLIGTNGGNGIGFYWDGHHTFFDIDDNVKREIVDPTNINYYVSANVPASTLNTTLANTRVWCNNGNKLELYWHSGYYIAFSVDNGAATGHLDGWVDSDIRLKEDIQDVNEALLNVAKELEFKRFIFKKNNPKDKYSVGVIAQDVIALFEKYGLDYTKYGVIGTFRDESGEVPGTEYFTIDYKELDAIFALGLQAQIKEQAKLIESLEKRVSELENN